MGDSDPAAKVAARAVKNARQQYVNRSQMLSLSRACTSRAARLAVRIAFYSGLRLGEILRADVRGMTFYLMDTKNRDPRIVPIHPRIMVYVRNFNQATPKITVSA
jgi:integrase